MALYCVWLQETNKLRDDSRKMEAETLLNVGLLLACIAMGWILIKKVFGRKDEAATTEPAQEAPPEIEDRDFTLEELLEFDGSDQSKPILVALNFNVYDVTRSTNMYGQGGPYHMFAGRDASRAFATLNLSKEDLCDGWDGLEDLKKGEQATLREWEEKYVIKYRKVGGLLKQRDKKND